MNPKWVIVFSIAVGAIAAMVNPFVGALSVVAAFFFGRMYEIADREMNKEE